MEDYISMSARLSELLTSLERGELNLDGLVELEEVTRKLHERSIILRYNAFKDMVAPKEEEPIAEVIVEEQVIEAVPELEEEEEEEEQAFDFSIFEEETPVEEPEMAFEPAPIFEEEAVIEEEPEIEMDEEEADVVIEAPIVEEPVAEEPVVEETPEVIPAAPVVEETPRPVTSSHPFLDRLETPDNSIAGRFAAGKLESLIGAFGLNERLRFINDLFDGSSELFSDAIKALDSQSDLSAARIKAVHYAEKHGWDPEEEVVADFMHYLSRRYA